MISDEKLVRSRLKNRIFNLKWQNNLASNACFRKACENACHLELADFLMNNAATLSIDLNSRGQYDQTAFILACRKGHADVVELLMENATTMSIDLNAKSTGGDTGFHRACYEGQTSTVELLLNNADALHLDLTSKGYNGKTGFQQAQFKNETAVVELIKAKRPSIAV